MEDTKPWWQSRTIWASVGQVALGVAVSMGVLTSGQSSAILAEGPDLLVGIASAVLGAWGLYGRVKASTKLTGV